MKIISKPDVSNWSYKHKCSQCDAELEIEANDLAYEEGDYRDGSAYITNCPVCNNKIYIAISKVPKLLEIQIKKRTNQSRTTAYYGR